MLWDWKREGRRIMIRYNIIFWEGDEDCLPLRHIITSINILNKEELREILQKTWKNAQIQTITEEHG